MWRYRMHSLYMTLTYAVWIGWYTVTDAVCRGCVKYVRMIGCGGSRMFRWWYGMIGDVR